MRTCIIGDVHGCSLSLTRLLAKIQPNREDDLIIFLGDYIDRGPDSAEVVEIILSLQAQGIATITLMGNHEVMLLNYLQGQDNQFYQEMGGCETLESYDIDPEAPADAKISIPENHIRFYQNLLPYWENEDYIFVHAGLQPGVHLSQQQSHWLFWTRDEFLQKKTNHKKQIIFGHTVFRQVWFGDHRIGLDTGAVFGGKLSCLILPEKQVIQVDGLKSPQYRTAFR